MTEKDIVKWVKTNLGPIIRGCVIGTGYSEDLIGGMVVRETGILINRYAPSNKPVNEISAMMRGDYSQRDGETEKKYHGYGFLQIDIDSFPAFVKSGNWKDPKKCIEMAIAVLNGKKKYLQPRVPVAILERAVVAAYNTGEGRVWKSLQEGKDVDARTYNHDYSKEVFRFREIYKALP